MQLSKGWIVINEEWSIVKSVIFTTEHWYSVFYWSMYCHWYMYMLPTLRVKVWQMVIGKYIIMYIRKTHVVFLVFLFFFVLFLALSMYLHIYEDCLKIIVTFTLYPFGQKFNHWYLSESKPGYLLLP